MIVQPDFLDHYKTQMLVDMTGDPASPLFILRLWAHCQQRRIARFSGLAPSALKAICRATALEANKLRSILLQCGFIRMEGDLTIVHDWEETNAALFGSWDNGRKGGRPAKPKPTDNPRVTGGLPTVNPEGTDKRREDEIRGEGVAPAREEGDSEIPDKSTCLGQAANQGVPADFAELVYVDWFSREGKDGAGILTPYSRLVARRWHKEQGEWKAGTHSSKKINGHELTKTRTDATGRVIRAS